jgi:hypothetical protein
LSRYSVGRKYRAGPIMVAHIMLRERISDLRAVRWARQNVAGTTSRLFALTTPGMRPAVAVVAAAAHPLLLQLPPLPSSSAVGHGPLPRCVSTSRSDPPSNPAVRRTSASLPANRMGKSCVRQSSSGVRPIPRLRGRPPRRRRREFRAGSVHATPTLFVATQLMDTSIWPRIAMSAAGRLGPATILPDSLVPAIPMATVIAGIVPVISTQRRPQRRFGLTPG